MDKTNAFVKAAGKVMTYAKVIQELNRIAQMSGTDYAGFSVDLKSVDGNKTYGFEFGNAQQEMQLAQLLDMLGIKFSHYKADVKSQKGQLHIDKEYHKLASELFYAWNSFITIEPRITGNAEFDAKWGREVSHTR
ncbi:MAG: hypothetical protein J6Q44_01250 [Alphaproteobacteria bacterium]|nr:hypothetical protein [Alphaproteobacteria bacterium]